MGWPCSTKWCSTRCCCASATTTRRPGPWSSASSRTASAGPEAARGAAWRLCGSASRTGRAQKPISTEPSTRSSRRGARFVRTRSADMRPSSDRPILVVDDDAKIVRLVRTYLEREGYPVIEASDGRQALSLIARHDPQLVVLDLMLPGIDGTTVIRAVRRTADTPIVVLSARGTTADRIAGLEDGADDYVPKPFSPAELTARVRRVLARAGAEKARPDEPPLVHGDLVIDRPRHTATVADRPIALSAVEFRLLAAIIGAEGRVLTRDQ